MILFIIVVSIMLLFALGLILPPLFRKNSAGTVDENEVNLEIGRERLRKLKADLQSGKLDQQAFDAARSELEQSLLDAISNGDQALQIKSSPWLMIILSLAIPVLAISIYLKTGNQMMLDQEALAQFQADQLQTPDIEVMVATLAERLQQTPDDGEGWWMLGRSYLVMNRFEEAVKAYSRANELIKDNAGLLVDYADAIARSQNNDLTGAAKPLIERALEIDPQQGKARWMAGLLAYQEGDFAKVPGFLEPLLDQTEQGSEVHQAISSLITEAQQNIPAQQTEPEQEISPAEQPIKPLNNGNAIAEDINLNIRVSLSPELQDQALPEETVFIFAKAMNGPPMPLAVKKTRVADLPLIVTLDDSQAMRPGLELSTQKMVNLTARISKSGDVAAASGDLQGFVGEISTQTKETIEITIDQMIP